MIRTVLSDAQWGRIKGLVPGKESDRGVTGRDNRLFVEAVLWVARVAFDERLAKNSIDHQGYFRFVAKSFNPVAQAPLAMP